MHTNKKRAWGDRWEVSEDTVSFYETLVFLHNTSLAIESPQLSMQIFIDNHNIHRRELHIINNNLICK